MLDSTVVCRRALGCEWGGGGRRQAAAPIWRLRGAIDANAANVQSVSQSLPHSYQRSTWPTVHSIFLVQRDLWTDYPEPGMPGNLSSLAGTSVEEEEVIRCVTVFACYSSSSSYLSRSSRDLVGVVVVDLGRRGQPCQGRVLGGFSSSLACRWRWDTSPTTEIAPRDSRHCTSIAGGESPVIQIASAGI